MQVLLLFAYCFLSQSNSFVAAWLALATSLRSRPTTHLEVECPDGNDSKPSQTLVGRGYFFFLFFSFLPSLPPSHTHYIPRAIMPSISHLMAFPLLSLGGSVCARAAVFVNPKWSPCCSSHGGSFALLALSGHSWGGDHAAFLWLVATCLSHKVQARFKHVLWCVYLQFGGRRVFGMNCCTYRI